VIDRGDIVLVALPGDYGKPRPALVVQADIGSDLPSVVLCPLTTTIRIDLPEFRLSVEPGPSNGLRQRSQVMVEKLVSLPRAKVREVIGKLDASSMEDVTSALAVLLGIV
jgi:mRNA interferase MazF